MKTHYFIEQYNNKWQVRTKIGRQLFGSHNTQQEANEQLTFLESLMIKPRFTCLETV
jgi:hypothetical protein